MPHAHPHSNEVRSLDTEVGDDGDTYGIAQELTADDIDDIAYSPVLEVGERLARLMNLRDEMLARRSGDLNGDMEETLEMIRDRIKILRSGRVEGDAELAATGMDSTDRSDDDDPAEFIAAGEDEDEDDDLDEDEEEDEDDDEEEEEDEDEEE